MNLIYLFKSIISKIFSEILIHEKGGKIDFSMEDIIINIPELLRIG